MTHKPSHTEESKPIPDAEERGLRPAIDPPKMPPVKPPKQEKGNNK